MIGLDTNVLVRYIVQDDAKQGRAAAALIEKQCTREEPGWIDTIVLCELFWVLKIAYGYPRDSIAAVIGRLLTVAELRVEESDLARAALRDYEKANVDFADCLIGIRNTQNDCTTTCTFDQRAARLPYFTSA